MLPKEFGNEEDMVKPLLMPLLLPVSIRALQLHRGARAEPQQEMFRGGFSHSRYQPWPQHPGARGKGGTPREAPGWSLVPLAVPDRRWLELDRAQQKAYVMHLLDGLEVVNRDKRLQVARAILYLAQGKDTSPMAGSAVRGGWAWLVQ